MSQPALPVTARVLPDLGEIAPAAWDDCAGDADPFVSHAFLRALEDSGAVSARTGWLAQHLVVEDGRGTLLGVAPLYLKGHSLGEYVFDWSWAEASERAGLPYYPKLLCAVPFTPVPGPRLLVRPGQDRRAVGRLLLSAMLGLAREHGLSSLHLDFIDERVSALCTEAGLHPRIGVQFHWHNRGYDSFEHYLSALIARKRKLIRKERRRARQAGVRLRVLSGEDITPRHWDAFYRCYRDTTGRKWGRAYLNRETFALLSERLGDRLLLVAAEQQGELVAAALNVRGRDALYGRYWGRLIDAPHLHFEICYHQAIELAIELGLSRVEAGAQGAHKLGRGYSPVVTHSAHFIAHRALDQAVGAYLERERREVARQIELLRADSPYRDERSEARATAPAAAE